MTRNGKITAKKDEPAEYSYISACRQLGYRRHNIRVLFVHNQGSTLFAYEDMPNVIVIYNFWKEHRLIVVNPNRTRHVKVDAINRE